MSQISASDRQRLVQGRHFDPHSILGAQDNGDGTKTVRAFHPHATAVSIITPEGTQSATHLGDGLFEGTIPTDSDHRLSFHCGDDAAWETANGYTWLPTLGEMDIYLIGEGRHERLWDVMGAHVRTFDSAMGTVKGTSFAVWAPNAQAVSVIGSFNGWNPVVHQMRCLGSSGIWEIFIPGVGDGDLYKFSLLTHEDVRVERADPMARRAEVPPATASIVTSSDYQWQDQSWMQQRRETDWNTQPVSVYEVHLGSWKQGRTYVELAEDLVNYVTDMGYTHVEFMPVAEHPFGGSWGYQVTGYYAPTSRYGSPDELRALIDAFHAAGIGVIVDWVPGHFPKDEWALARFDGRACYEHPDWRRGEQRDWGTYVFDYGRPEVRNFLVANALYWMHEFHIDGIRVDAVASMLYLDYSRKEGEWEPNQFGGRENLEAVQFLQEMNATVHRAFPGALTIAEESTSWPGVTAPTSDNGLGFSMKWNMGWMHDTLEYIAHDPIHRPWHHSDITFSLVYAWSEKFMLPISHDEVVHGKGTLWTRMPGDTWNKAAGLRTYLAFMWAHPGKQLLFMGQDFGQIGEWNNDKSLDWQNMDGWEGEYHRGVLQLVKDMNHIYSNTPALYSMDDTSHGFSWICADDAQNGVLSFLRKGTDGQQIACIFNFSGSTYSDYQLGITHSGTWRAILNTDSSVYEGAGYETIDRIEATDEASHGYPASIRLTIPAMSAVWLQREG